MSNHIYDYAIYGGGPTGMTLALLLSYNNYSVVLVEKDDKLGGCWKEEWKENKYFSEHSPRVLLQKNDYFFRLLEYLKYDINQNTKSTYGNLFQTNYKLLSFFIKRLSTSDMYKTIQSYFKR